MIKSNTNILIDVLYFSANMSYIEYKPSVAVLPYVPKNDLSLIKSSLYRVPFSRMYNLDTDIIYKIEAK